MRRLPPFLHRIAAFAATAWLSVPAPANPLYPPWGDDPDIPEAAYSRRLIVYPDRLDESLRAVHETMPKLGCIPSYHALSFNDCSVWKTVFRSAGWICSRKREAEVVRGLQKVTPVTDSEENIPIDLDKADAELSTVRGALHALEAEIAVLEERGAAAGAACALATAEAERKRYLIKRYEQARARLRFDIEYISEALADETAREASLLCGKLKQDLMRSYRRDSFNAGAIKACGMEWPAGYWSRSLLERPSPCHGTEGNAGFVAFSAEHAVAPTLAYYGGEIFNRSCGAVPPEVVPKGCRMLAKMSAYVPTDKMAALSEFLMGLPGAVRFAPENPAAVDAVPGSAVQADRYALLASERKKLRPASFAPITDYLVSDAMGRSRDPRARGKTVVQIVLCDPAPPKALIPVKIIPQRDFSPRTAVIAPMPSTAPIYTNPTP